jgi:hypothetical protein
VFVHVRRHAVHQPRRSHPRRYALQRVCRNTSCRLWWRALGKAEAMTKVTQCERGSPSAHGRIPVEVNGPDRHGGSLRTRCGCLPRHAPDVRPLGQLACSCRSVPTASEIS